MKNCFGECRESGSELTQFLPDTGMLEQVPSAAAWELGSAQIVGHLWQDWLKRSV